MTKKTKEAPSKDKKIEENSFRESTCNIKKNI